MTLYQDLVAAFQEDDAYTFVEYNVVSLKDLGSRDKVTVRVKPVGRTAGTPSEASWQRVEVEVFTDVADKGDPYPNHDYWIDRTVEWLRKHPDYDFFPLTEALVADNRVQFNGKGQVYLMFTVLVRDG